MVTRLKPQRVKSSNSPQVGQNLGYEDSNNFKWQDTGSGVGDMKYSDFQWETLTGNAITIEDISNNITPSSDFTVSAGTVKPGIEYVLRVNTGSTPYTMTLGTGITNPNSYKTELKPNTVNQFKFIATSTTQLELEGIDLDTKTFHLTGTTGTDNLVTAQEAFDWVSGGNNAFIVYDGASYALFSIYNSGDSLGFMAEKNLLTDYSSTSTIYRKTIDIRANSGVVYEIETNTNGIGGFLRAGHDYQTPYSPEYNGSPATKKYVDDSISAATAGAVSDAAYGTSWDGVTGIAPSKNVVYNKINSMDTTIAGKQDTLTPGSNISISGNTISSTDTTYTAGTGINIDSNNEISNTGVTSFNGQTGAVTYTAPVSSVNNQTGAVTVLESQTKVFPMPAVGDDISDLVSWLSAGKIAILFEGDDTQGDRDGQYYQIYSFEEGLGFIYCEKTSPGNSNTVEYWIRYSTSTYIVQEKQQTVKLFAPTGGTAGQVLTQSSNNSPYWATPSGGDVNGPASSTDGNIALFDGATGKIIKDSGASLADYQEKLTAGIGIGIGTAHPDNQGPCGNGFHIPTLAEISALKDIMGTFSLDGGTYREEYIHLPKAGRLNTSVTTPVQSQAGIYGRYWTCELRDEMYDNYYSARSFYFSSGMALDSSSPGNGYSVRPFADTPSMPDNTWTIVYDGSSTATNAGIFYKSSLGLISASSDGVNWITISDKNLGATTVFNYGDTLSETNCGKYYQRGNNYGFARDGTVLATTNTAVDVTGYGPGNYYSSSTIYAKYTGIYSIDSWFNPVWSPNLWGGYTQGIWIDSTTGNSISNTGVISVNGQTGAVTISGGDVVVSSQTGNILQSGMKIWAGTETDFGSLTPDSNTVYLLTAGQSS